MSLTPVPPPQHKAGSSFTRLFVVPPEIADGFFVGWVPASQVRDQDGNLVADVTCTWLDPATTRNLRLRVSDTRSWSKWAGKTVEIDVVFTRASDGEVMPTTTASFAIVRKVTG